MPVCCTVVCVYTGGEEKYAGAVTDKVFCIHTHSFLLSNGNILGGIPSPITRGIVWNNGYAVNIIIERFH